MVLAIGYDMPLYRMRNCPSGNVTIQTVVKCYNNHLIEI